MVFGGRGGVLELGKWGFLNFLFVECAIFLTSNGRAIF
jgi:hypothetical protein